MRERWWAEDARPRWPAGAVLGLIWLAAAAFHYGLSLLAPYPWVFNDELEYWGFAHQILHGHWILYFESKLVHYPNFLYPLFLALVIAPFHGAHAQYVAARLAGILVLPLVAVPTYHLAREVGGSHRKALWAAALAAFLPGMDYALNTMAEVLYLPLFVTAMLLVRRWAATPSRGRALAAGAVSALAVLAKPQGLLLLPVSGALALWHMAHGRRGWATYGWYLAAVGLLVPLRLAFAAHEGYRHLFTVRALLGFYAEQRPGTTMPPLSLELPTLVAYAALLVIAGAGLPVWAWTVPRKDRILWWLAGSSSAILLLVFSRNTVLFDVLHYRAVINEPLLRASERYLFPVLPLWAVAALAGGTARRPGGSLLGVGLAAVAAFLTFPPFIHFLLTFDSPTLTGLYVLDLESQRAHLTLWLAVLVAAWAVVAAAAMVLARPGILLAALVAMSVAWPFGTYVTNSRANYYEAMRLLPWVQATLPRGSVLAWNAQTVNSGVAHNVEYFSLLPAVRLTSLKEPVPHPRRTWLLTAAAAAPAGSPAYDGFALVPPGRWETR